MSKKNNNWYRFHIELMRYELYLNNRKISKFIAFWTSKNPSLILENKSSIKKRLK